MKTQLELGLLFLCVARGKRCTEDDLSMYSGNVSITNGGRICQNWTSQSPHAHLFFYNGDFPQDRTVEDAANFCRTVGWETIPWCYTTDPRKRWDYCNKMICGEPVCGGIVSESTGVIMWPDAYGVYDRNVDCLWTIVAPEHRRVEFEVTRMDIHKQRVCFYNYIAIYDDTHHYGRYCGTKKTPLILSRSTTLYIRFDSEDVRSTAGFNANYSQVEKANETTGDPESLQDYPVGDVMCSAGVDTGLYTGKVNVTESGRTCMHWKDTSLEPQRWTAEDENFCRNIGYATPWCETIDRKIEYCYENICKGAACGGNFTTPSGWLSAIDGDLDGDYDAHRECLWTLIAPEDYGIVIEIKFLSISDASKCEFEKLQIYANVLEMNRFCGSLLSVPVTLRFKSNLVFVFFKSDFAEVPGPGFRLTYIHVAVVNITTTTEGAACGGNFTTPSGWLNAIDGDHDGNYDAHRECLWTLIAPEDYGIVVEIKFLSIADASECEFEKLEIYANVLETNRFCGSLLSVPVTLRFKSNLLFVFFKSEFAEVPGPGFRLTYVHVAVVNITSTTEATVSETRTVADEQTLPVVDPETTEDKLAKVVRTQTTFFISDSTEGKESGCVRMTTSNVSFKFNLTVISLIMFGWISNWFIH